MKISSTITIPFAYLFAFGLCGGLVSGCDDDDKQEEEECHFDCDCDDGSATSTLDVDECHEDGEIDDPVTSCWGNDEEEPTGSLEICVAPKDEQESCANYALSPTEYPENCGEGVDLCMQVLGKKTDEYGPLNLDDKIALWMAIQKVSETKCGVYAYENEEIGWVRLDYYVVEPDQTCRNGLGDKSTFTWTNQQPDYTVFGYMVWVWNELLKE